MNYAELFADNAEEYALEAYDYVSSTRPLNKGV